MTDAAIVLAAGKGTRFRSDLAKVLHPVAGRTLLRWVLEAARPLELERIVVVVGYQADAVRAEAEASGINGLRFVEQSEQRGTGHAARVALESGELDDADTVLVLPGDGPLLTSQVLGELLDAHRGGAATLLTTKPADPTGLGRIVRDGDGRVLRIVEELDASEEERGIDEVGTSTYVFERQALGRELARLGTGNAQGEEYLTDVVAPLAAAGVAAVVTAPEVAAGVNDLAQLAHAGSILRSRILERLMLDGVTVVDPAATYVGPDVTVEPDAVLLPGTHLEGACRIGAGARVGPDCRLVDTEVEAGASVSYAVAVQSSIGPGALVGPYASLRPGTRLEAGAKAGTFVEMKASTIGEGSKVSHLSYIGDATIGRDVNVGAATVTVNYDGYAKHKTVIGDRASIGSDSMLVAPVRIGDDAVTGAGSVITKDVPEGALAVERSEQRIVPGYTERKRSRRGKAGDTEHGEH